MRCAQKNENLLPFKTSLIPVINKLKDLEKFLEKYPGFSFCIYVADRNKVEWAHSTSRKYMNNVLPGFIYLPFNIKRDDSHTLREVYKFCENHPSIIAVNQSKPHISNPILFELYPASPLHVDALIKNKYGKLKPMGLEGPAFTSWFLEEVGQISKKTVICFGVGSTGEGIVHEIAHEHPLKVYLIDIRSKVILASDLGEFAHYFPRLEDLTVAADDELLLVYTLGRELKGELSSVVKFMNNHSDKKHIFVDIRPQLKLSSVDQAVKAGWTAYTGSAKTARNNYILMEKIAEYIGAKYPSYDDFSKLVRASS